MMSSRTISSAINRVGQVSQQLSSQAPIRQQLRMASTSKSGLKLNTGAVMPAVGFGTWQDKDAQETAVATALQAGYRHIDTAHIYGTEPAVGRGIKKSGVPRDQIFITTKLWNNAHDPKSVEPALDASLNDLGVDHVDLFLMHWPSPFQDGDKMLPKDDSGNVIPGKADYVDTYKAMEECQKKGKTKAIGVSNFSQKEMERLVKEVSIAPAAHQFECHPWLQQPDFNEWHRKNGIVVMQYSPFGNQNEIYDKGAKMGKLMDDPTLVQIGKKYQRSGAQVALAWGIAHDRCVLPKSKTESRIKSNLDGDFQLEAEDVKAIDAINKGLRFNDPSGTFRWNFYEDLEGKE